MVESGGFQFGSFDQSLCVLQLSLLLQKRRSWKVGDRVKPAGRKGRRASSRGWVLSHVLSVRPCCLPSPSHPGQGGQSPDSPPSQACYRLKYRELSCLKGTVDVGEVDFLQVSVTGKIIGNIVLYSLQCPSQQQALVSQN